MKLINIDNINIPNKKDEKFRKVDFSQLFNQEFKEIKAYTLDLNLNSIDDNTKSDDILYSLAQTLDKKQYILEIKEDTKEPIVLIHTIKEDDTLFTNSLKIELKKGVKASLIEVFVNDSQNSVYVANRVFNLEDNSDFKYIKIQDISSENSLLYNANFNQAEKSLCNASNFEFGDGFIINNFNNELNHKEVDYILNGLVKSKNSANTSNLIKTTHNASNTSSDIKFKHTLKHKAKTVFKVMSVVNENALYTKAHQSSKTILLSNDAVIYAQPHLEIFIDELEASHGATTGTLNKDQLLYLRSRGINKDLAYEILLDAFETEMYEANEDEQLTKFVKNYKRNSYV